MTNGVIYIMTNKGMPGMVRLGYSEDVEAKRKQLSTTDVPFEYEIYAVYHIQGRLDDRKLHWMIDTLNPKLRVNKHRVFFSMTPEDAYHMLYAIAVISGTENNLKFYPEDDEGTDESKLNQPNVNEEKPEHFENESMSKNKKRPKINFLKCGIPVGARLVFTKDPSIVVTVANEREVVYKGKVTSLSKVARNFFGLNQAQGPRYFTYFGEPLLDIVNRTQWKDFN